MDSCRDRESCKKPLQKLFDKTFASRNGWEKRSISKCHVRKYGVHDDGKLESRHFGPQSIDKPYIGK